MAVTLKIRGDASGLNRTLQDVQGRFGKFGSGIMGVMGSTAGAIGIVTGAVLAVKAAIVGVIAATIKWAASIDKVAKSARKLNISSDDYQKFSVMAQMAGTNVDTLAMALKRAEKAAGDAVRGNKTIAEAFELMGTSAKEFINASPADRLGLLSQGLAKLEEKGLAATTMSELLGRNWAELRPLFQASADSLRDQAKAIDTISPKYMKLGELVTDLWTLFKSNTIAAAMNLAGAAVMDVYLAVQELRKAWAEWTGDIAKVQQIRAQVRDILTPGGPTGQELDDETAAGLASKSPRLGASPDDVTNRAIDERIAKHERLLELRRKERALAWEGVSASVRMEQIMSEIAHWQGMIRFGGDVELSAREKLVELGRQLLDVQRDLAEEAEREAEAVAKARKDRADILDKGMADIDSRINAFAGTSLATPSTSALQAMGGGAGAFGPNGADLVNYSKQQVALLQAIHRVLYNEARSNPDSNAFDKNNPL